MIVPTFIKVFKRMMILMILFSIFSFIADVKLNRDYKKITEKYCDCFFNTLMVPTDNISVEDAEVVDAGLYAISEDDAISDLHKRLDVLRDSLMLLEGTDDSHAEKRTAKLVSEFKTYLLQMSKISEKVETEVAIIQFRLPSVIATYSCTRYHKRSLIMRFIPHDRERKFYTNMTGKCAFIGQLAPLFFSK